MNENSAIIRSVTGRHINLLTFGPDDVEQYAIVCGLSKVCRFAGQLEDFYSVAQHTLLVAELVDEPYRLQALLHDASEAYIGDISRNLKTSPIMERYRGLETQVQNAIYDAFGVVVTEETHQHIKAADDLAAVYERVLIRDSKPWDGVHIELVRAFESGFVSSARRNTMLEMACRLPAGWNAWSPELSRRVLGHDLEVATS